MKESPPVLFNHKDAIFRMLYQDKKELLSLYNALNGTAYRDADALEMYTLENSIYVNLRNDVAFLLCSELNLYEHQASVNPNMPLRHLGYVARELERYLKGTSLYSSALVKIPTPRFVVFYNGTDKMPERSVIKLSDAFFKPTSDPELELKVQMFNINLGYNRELMEKCESLKGYSILTARIRSYAGQMPLREAADRAVSECIHENILKDFLSKQRAEVIRVSFFVTNWEEELKMIRRQEFQEGQRTGIERGIEQGKADGIANSLLVILSRFGKIEDSLQNAIENEKSEKVLLKWVKEAAAADTLENFKQRISC